MFGKPCKPALAAVQLAGCYALALFHRTCGAVLLVPVAATFEVPAEAVSGIAIVYFWVYAILQLPSGVLADVLGARRLAIAGAVAMGAGGLAFGLSGDVAIAILARAIIAAGCAVIFVSMVSHVKAHWPTDQVATITGRSIFLGNLGTIASSAPLAMLLLLVDWRTLSCWLGAISFAFAIGLWLSPSEAAAPRIGRARLRMVLPQIRCVLTNRYNHCALVILAGLAGSYWAFVGLCALPLLVSKGLASGAAVWNVTGMMACYAVGAPVFGWIGDRLNRCGMTLSLACAGSVVCWGVLASGVALPAATLALVVYLLGFCCGAFHLVFALVMERNPVEHTGTAASYINIGTFLGAAVMQSLAAVLGSVAGAAACALPMAVASVLSLVLSASLWPVRERAQLKRRRRAFAVTKA